MNSAGYLGHVTMRTNFQGVNGLTVRTSTSALNTDDWVVSCFLIWSLVRVRLTDSRSSHLDGLYWATGRWVSLHTKSSQHGARVP